MLAEYRGGIQAIITAVEEAKSACIELYDSSIMWHLSPYCEDFITYRALKPLLLYLNAANKQQFLAVVIGSIVINTPLGAVSSELTLENILSVGYTLISLGMLDLLGYHMSLDARHLKITSLGGSVVMHVP